MHEDFPPERQAQQTMHSQLAQAFAAQRDALNLSLRAGLHDARWQALHLEWLYHGLCAQGTQALHMAADCTLDVLDVGSPDAFDQPFAETIRRAGETLGDPELVAFGTLCRAFFEATHQRHFEAIAPLLNKLVELSRALPAERQATAHRVRGLHFLRLERYPEALADFELAILLNPQRADLYFQRGRVQHALGNLQAA
ncbi:MAG: hypothetical protein CUN49_14915, partial [Candidatus Thermofonsia Clade 1 bacterium]